MALSRSALVLVLLTISLCGASLGAVHKVGDSAGWTTTGDVDYRKWASSHKFMVGDTLVFEYNKQFHNVIQVTHQDFRSCNATSPIVSYTSGSDSITIKRPGHLYFLCGVPGHCQQGQKVDIRVPRASLSPTSSPSHAPTGSPADSPTTSPDRDGAPSPIQNDSAFLHCSKLWLVLGFLAVFICSAVPAIE